jgi:hypothetical protein
MIARNFTLLITTTNALKSIIYVKTYRCHIFKDIRLAFWLCDTYSLHFLSSGIDMRSLTSTLSCLLMLRLLFLMFHWEEMSLLTGVHIAGMNIVLKSTIKRSAFIKNHFLVNDFLFLLRIQGCRFYSFLVQLYNVLLWVICGFAALDYLTVSKIHWIISFSVLLKRI